MNLMLQLQNERGLFMVALAKEPVELQGTIKDVVCPVCAKPLPYPRICSHKKDRYGREIRTYFGWCFFCANSNCDDAGCEVIQFKRDNKWFIHKYQQYAIDRQHDTCRPAGKWITLNELPEPAPVVTGPGGDYDKSIEPAVVSIIEPLYKILSNVTQLLGSLLKKQG